MMDELSYMFDEENPVISKLFATMSDRSSVNKKFNKDLGNIDTALLILVVNVYNIICIVFFIWPMSTNVPIREVTLLSSKSG